MTTDANPLEALLTDAVAVDTERLAGALKGYFGIDSKNGQPVQGDNYADLTSDRKMLGLMLAREAAVLLGRADESPLAAKEFIELSGLPEGTVYPALRSLAKANLAQQDDEKRYFVPRHRILAAVEALRDD